MESQERALNENKVVMGIFRTRSDIERAVEELRAQGFRSADISALLPSSDSTKQFAHQNATKLPEGAAAGGVTGAVLGGTLGWLAGIGSLAIPGLGALVAAGPIVGMLAGAGVGGAVGGVSGALIGLGVPEYEAKRYEGMVKDGGFLLSVHCDRNDWCSKAKEILATAGATDLSTSTEARSDSHASVREDVPRQVGSTGLSHGTRQSVR